MEQIIIYIALTLIGLCMGSFAGATVWRLRARQLELDKASGDMTKSEIADYKHLKKLTKTKLFNDRSRCLSCSYQLKWYDLIPLFSWLSLRGKCRKCRNQIGYFEPIIEFGVAVFFVLSYAFWPYQLADIYGIFGFGLWLAMGVVLAVAFAYDAKWMLIPDSVNFTAIGIGVANSALVLLTAIDKANTLVNIVGAALVLSGLYLLIYIISKHKWVGFGDVKLGLGLALMLVDWKLAFIALFSANLIGCIVVIPAMAMGKLKRDAQVPFGPLLIIGYGVAALFGNQLITFYYSLLLG